MTGSEGRTLSQSGASRPARLATLVRPWLRSIGLLAAVSLAGGLVEAVVLVLITQGAFSVAGGGDQTLDIGGWSFSISALVLIGSGLVGLRMVLGALSSRLAARLGAAAVARTRLDLADAYSMADWATTHKDRSGRLQELLTNFAGHSGDVMFNLTRITFAFFALVALLVVALLVDLAASVAALAVFSLLLLILRPLRREVRLRAGELAAENIDLATALAEVDALDLEIRIFGARRPIRVRLDALIDRVALRYRRLRFRQELAIPAASSLLYAAMFAALAVVSATAGADLASVGAVMLILLRSFSYAQMLQIAAVGLESALPFIDELHREHARLEAARSEVGDVPVGSVRTITLVDVHFSYEEGVPVLNGIDASIGPNEIVGVIGPSGAGKSTLAYLILGLLSPSAGSVLADGCDIAELSDAGWRAAVSFVPQQPHLVAGTVADNVRFFRENVSDEAVRDAARLAHIHDEIVVRPGGYEGDVGERGGALSIGQQQRLTIARALVAEPHVLILDEPTSALDARNDHLVQSSLRALREHMTIIVIAHRRSTLDICDRVMVIEGGVLRAFDAPERLRRDSRHYRELIELSDLT